MLLAKCSGSLSLFPSLYFRRSQRLRPPDPASNPAKNAADSAVGKTGKGAGLRARLGAEPCQIRAASLRWSAGHPPADQALK